jgi:hypothetical protein
MPEKIFLTVRLVVLGAVLLAFAKVPNAHADSATCLAKAGAFVAELDELLDKEKYHSQPYSDLAERYFPLGDCEAEALLDVVRQSRFIRSISYFPHKNEYFISFERDYFGASFGYFVSERKSELAGAGVIRKPGVK